MLNHNTNHRERSTLDRSTSPARSKKFALSTLACFAIASPNAALMAASTPYDSFSHRWFVGFGTGYSKLAPSPDSGDLSVSDSTSSGLNFRIGVDLSERFSLHAYTADLGKAKLNLQALGTGSIDYSVYGLGLTTYIFNSHSPQGMSQRKGLSTYINLGVGRMSNSSDEVTFTLEHDTHLMLGLGIEYGLSRGFSINAEATSYDEDAEQLSLTLIKRFGDSKRINNTKHALNLQPITAALSKPISADRRGLTQRVSIPSNIASILFDTAKSNIDTKYLTDLKYLASSLIETPEVGIVIDGHTDAVGLESDNVVLSNRRAQAIQNVLIDYGVEPARLKTKGYGESQPIASNNDEMGRQENRRVKISLTR